MIPLIISPNSSFYLADRNPTNYFVDLTGGGQREETAKRENKIAA